MRKPIVKTLLSILLVAVVLVGGTLAYMLATDSPVLNTFKLAEVETNIEEPESGTDATKSAWVANTGESAVYVRAKVLISSGDAGVTEDKFGFTYSTDWEDGSDGFYYYKGILQPQDETTPLFTGVTVSPDVPKEATFSVDVYQESVLAPADGSYSLTAAQAAFAAKG